MTIDRTMKVRSRRDSLDMETCGTVMPLRLNAAEAYLTRDVANLNPNCIRWN